MSRVLTELRLTLRRLIRLAFFRRTPRGAPGAGRGTLAILLVLSFAGDIALTAAMAGHDPAFYDYGIAPMLAGWAMFAALIALLSGGLRRAPLSRAMADLAAVNVAAFGLFLLGWIIARSFANWHEPPKSLSHALSGWVVMIGAWQVIVLGRAGRSLWRVPLRFAGLRFLIAVFLPLFLLPDLPVIVGSDTSWARHDAIHYAEVAFHWHDGSGSEEDAAGDQDATPVDYEAMLFRQPELVNQAAGRLLPPPPSRRQIYFVGVAPSSVQTVFRKEVLGAQAIFDQRFGTAHRSLVLINSLDTAPDTPLAANTNLDVVLSKLGKIMRPDKDVLVLFLTTHGSKGELMVSMPGIELNQITPEWLAGELDRSGIRNRVLIISACHAGSFIPALAGPNTLVMAAASAEKTSFGCSNEREWTYFGDALFNHALRSTRSLGDAFATANGLIKGWETDQKLTSSEPQLSTGGSITAIWDEAVADLDKSQAAVSQPLR